MRLAIRQIDRALKRLYELGRIYRAEDFLLRTLPQAPKVGNRDLTGALFIREEAAPEPELSVGIYLSEPVRQELSRFPHWRGTWSFRQLSAFGVAIEEVSHFHYLLYHAARGRQLTQLELELQGEIDKFVLLFFSRVKAEEGGAVFSSLFNQLFVNFHFSDSLSDEEKARYRDANGLARRFVLRVGPLLAEPSTRGEALRLLRRFYRLSSSEKISALAA